MKHKKALLAMVLALTLMLGVGVGGTAAWLAAKTTAVTNTFTYGDINIRLEEHKNGADGETTTTGLDNLKLVPGVNVKKDPFVTVQLGSEKCWAYVIVEEKNWPATDVTYAIDDTVWQEIKGASGVPEGAKLYGTQTLVDASVTVQTLNVLQGEQVVVKPSLKKTTTPTVQPQLIFTAYAIQEGSWNSAETAWNAVNTGDLSGDFVVSQ